MPLTTGAVSLLGSRPGVWRQRAARPFPTYRGRAARVVRVDAGVKYKRDEVEVNRQIGEGSFGIVYQGKIDKRKAGDVVLKRPKLTVEGAAELQEVEAWMNDRVSRDARGACADFLGSFRVTPTRRTSAYRRGSSLRRVCGSCGSTRAIEPLPSTWLSRTIPWASPTRCSDARGTSAATPLWSSR